MEHIRKICPVCGNEFVVLKSAEEKAVYCTLECLSEAQGRIKKRWGSLSAGSMIFTELVQRAFPHVVELSGLIFRGQLL